MERLKGPGGLARDMIAVSILAMRVVVTVSSRAPNAIGKISATIPIRTPMIVTTTRISIRVKPLSFRLMIRPPRSGVPRAFRISRSPFRAGQSW